MSGADTALAVELAGLLGVAERLLGRHVPDPQGRCRGCTVAGTGRPGAAWPCALHFYASAAVAIRSRGPADHVVDHPAEHGVGVAAAHDERLSA